jgi:hypothetical protein
MRSDHGAVEHIRECACSLGLGSRGPPRIVAGVVYNQSLAQALIYVGRLPGSSAL